MGIPFQKEHEFFRKITVRVRKEGGLQIPMQFRGELGLVDPNRPGDYGGVVVVQQLEGGKVLISPLGPGERALPKPGYFIYSVDRFISKYTQVKYRTNIKKEELYLLYLKWCKIMEVKAPTNRIHFGRAMRRVYGRDLKAGLLRDHYTGKQIGHYKDVTITVPRDRVEEVFTAEASGILTEQIKNGNLATEEIERLAADDGDGPTSDNNKAALAVTEKFEEGDFDPEVSVTKESEGKSDD